MLEDGSVPDGISLFPRKSQEKSAGFYVDYDPTAGAFMAPEDQVKPSDAAVRMMAVVTLAQKALAVHTILTDSDIEFSLREWSKVALRLCAGSTYQQDMPALLDGFAAQSDRHRRLRERVDEGMKMTAEALKRLKISKSKSNDA